MYKEILVPLDGSEVSASSLPAARQLANSLGARVHLLQVSSQTEEFAVLREPSSARWGRTTPSRCWTR